ncbi:AraC family transcriptional regulator [Bradyrhizobium cosmicum]|uniref:AraC/XylS family transcriptional regulatory protein n=1 Tax=Bradyrhizobium cosmicum TaxID=1404864 RepID=A0AAI8QF47_9BRAD|nr:AraC family transcriptional regulator [Bradyrhizobium cosmicum]BAL79196.1 AraC/XylS family transcriptional regulatory protein [Bradyrhizobium cosmicum]
MRDVSCLDRYPSFRSSDSAVARELLFSVYGADRFDSRDPNFGVRANFANLTSIGLAFCAYAGAASVSFPESNIVRQFFAIDGTASFRAKAASRPIAGWSPMIAGDSRLDLDFQAGYRQLVVRIDAGALERLLKSIIADDSDRRLSFVEDDSDPAVMALARQDVFRFAEELDRFGQNYSPTAIAELERSLMVRLLLAHRHNFSRQLHDAPPRAKRSVVDIVESYIEAHWDQPLDLEKIAAIANVGVRTVFREFAESGRGSPGLFARHVRLRKAAESLRHPDQHTCVLSVAFKCGFRNPGRFASEYRQVIGELPSQTLAAARRRR